MPQTEQVAHRREQVVLDRPAMRHQRIRGTVEPHHAHGLEVRARQLAEGAALAQPAPGGALRSRRRHAGDDRSHGRGTQRTVEAPLFQELAESELLHRPQPDMFDAHRARSHHLEGIHIHAVHHAAWKARTITGAADKLRRNALCLAFHRLGTWQRQHRGLGRQKPRDPVAQHPPVLAVHGKVASQVEQGLLTDCGAVTPGAHQAMGEVRLAVPGGSGPGAPDETDRRPPAVSRARKTTNVFYGTTFRFTETTVSVNHIVTSIQTRDWPEKKRNPVSAR